MNPLLSICVPTFDRASRLRVMLQAVLPQVAQHEGRVELWVSDNASTDETPRVVEDSTHLGPLRYSRNHSNVGIIGNFVKATTELACGQFVWVLGDDDLLLPGALARVLARVEANRELDATYLNFRYANYPEHWPEDALGGYSGPFVGVANPEFDDRQVSRWHELIRPASTMCTQVYAHVVRRDVWLGYWRGRKLGEPYSDVRMTFPHSCMLAETVMHEPSFYVGEPVLNIFNGAQSWTDLQSLVMLLRLPELLRFYQKQGLPAEQVRECEKVVFGYCEPYLADILRGDTGPGSPTVGAYLRSNWRYAEAWRVLARACRATGRPRAAVRLLSVATRLRVRSQKYL